MKSTSLLTFMYHRIYDPSQSLPYEHFEQHLQQLMQKAAIVTPGDPLKKGALNVCLTFDDAYCDFYFYVYPLLKKYNVKALLAVTPRFVMDRTTVPTEQRLNVPYPLGMDDITAKEQAPFCTWAELQEMLASGHVVMASHGYSHQSLRDKKSDLKQEIIASKALLEKKLKTPIKYYVYPYGAMTRKAHQEVLKHYELGFRIGSALNRSFEPSNRMIYRVDADPYWQGLKALEPDLSGFMRKYWINRLRFK